MAHVFISYVRADADKIDRLALDLYRASIDTWTDRDLRPGQRWKLKIRQAIQQGASFLACFSPEVFTRDRTYMYEEINTAIEVLRQSPGDRTWFIPVRLDACDVPEFEIGAGLTLRDFQWVDLFPDWEPGVAALADAIRASLTHVAFPPAAVQEPRLPPLRREPTAGVWETWRSVWTVLFQLKVAGEHLFTDLSVDNLRRYDELLDSAVRKVGESAFYFDRDDFEQLEALLNRGFAFTRGKTSLRHLLSESEVDGRRWDDLRQAINLNVATFEQFSQLLVELRDRYAARRLEATGHPAWRDDSRSLSKITTLAEAAAQSKRRAEIRRAAEAMLRRGEISSATDCPRGHGRLREWEGLPRCWTCGWPWKDLGTQGKR